MPQKYGVPVWIRPLAGFVVVEADSASEAMRKVRNGEGDLAAEDVNGVGRSDVSGLRRTAESGLLYNPDLPLVRALTEDELTTIYGIPGGALTGDDGWDDDHGVPW